MKKLAILLLASPFLLAMAGCPKDPYRAAIQGSADVSQAVSAGIKYRFYRNVHRQTTQAARQ